MKSDQTKKTVCIITPGYISSSPRVVKEADALWQAGYHVRVVFTQGNLSDIRAFDRALLSHKLWDWDVLEWGPDGIPARFLYYKSKLRYHTFRRLPSIFSSLMKVAEYAEGRNYKELAMLAASKRADLYIGHYPTGLAASAYAARRWNTKFCYDVEDLHTGELPDARNSFKQTKRIQTLEKRYLPSCSHVTVVSDPVADEMVQRYRIPRPLVVHNVFPLSERLKTDKRIKDRHGTSLSLYWYSQVIGLDRGIQDVIRAASLLSKAVQIHLRGYITQEAKAELLQLARECSVADHIHFHSPVSPDELLSRAVEHDIGLALEQPVSENRLLTVTNKLFFYLLAGLAVAATDTDGQRLILRSCPLAGFLYAPGDYRALATHLQKLIDSPNLLRDKKEAALLAAQDRWNWERESQKLVELVAFTLNDRIKNGSSKDCSHCSTTVSS